MSNHPNLKRTISIGIAAMIAFFWFGADARAQTCSESIEQGKSYFGQYHLGKDHYEKASAAYLEAAADPACAYEAYWRLGDLSLCWGTYLKSEPEKRAQFVQGVAYAQKAIETHPEGREGHYQYGANLGSLVQMDGVMKALIKVRKIKKANDRALAIDPDFAPALVVKARFMSDMPGIFGGSDKKAEALLKKAMQKAPDWETAHVELASFLVRKKRFAEARAVLDRLLLPDFQHPFAAPWETIDKPRAEKLQREVEAAMQAAAPRSNP